jgi:cobalt-zinc-cadmium efflux system outer membrane protein
MFGFNIPIWFQKTEAAIRQARYDLAATQAEFAATRNTIFQQVQEALADVRAQQELAELFAESIVPQAQQAYESALSNYRAGAADFEFLIENWQKWLRFQIQYHRALGGLERAVADLEQALGVSLASAQQGALPSGESSPEPQPTGDER